MCTARMVYIYDRGPVFIIGETHFIIKVSPPALPPQVHGAAFEVALLDKFMDTKRRAAAKKK